MNAPAPPERDFPVQHEVGCVPLRRSRAVIYAEGWQSWSVATPLPVTVSPYQVTSRESLAIDCQYGATAPPGVHQGAGLLAVDPGDGGPVEVFAAVDVEHQVPVIQARAISDFLIVYADGPVTRGIDAGERGLTGALGRWADEFAARAGVVPGRLGPVPPVWCSWYQYYSAVTEDDILDNLDAMDELDVPVGVVQIDDGYEAAPGDWLLASGRFRDLPGLVARIRDSGRRAGIWIAPMLVGRSSELMRHRPGWVVRGRPNREPVFAGTVCGQECTALDITHPAAARHLAGVLRTMRDWGIDYFKIDFLYAGAIEGRRHEDISGVHAYRRGLRLIREAIGPGALLLGCGAPILPSVGLVEAMRVGPDIAAEYEPPDGNPSKPSQRAATRNTLARAWQQGRFWINDPDCLMIRPGVQRRADWAALVERHGALRSSGDGLRRLDRWGLETTRRLLRPARTGPIA